MKAIAQVNETSRESVLNKAVTSTEYYGVKKENANNSISFEHVGTINECQINQYITVEYVGEIDYYKAQFGIGHISSEDLLEELYMRTTRKAMKVINPFSLLKKVSGLASGFQNLWI